MTQTGHFTTVSGNKNSADGGFFNSGDGMQYLRPVRKRFDTPRLKMLNLSIQTFSMLALSFSSSFTSICSPLKGSPLTVCTVQPFWEQLANWILNI